MNINYNIILKYNEMGRGKTQEEKNELLHKLIRIAKNEFNSIDYEGRV